MNPIQRVNEAIEEIRKGIKLLITTKMHSFTGLNGFGLKIEEEIEEEIEI
jgi:hypothetical protein